MSFVTFKVTLASVEMPVAPFLTTLKSFVKVEVSQTLVKFWSLYRVKLNAE